PSGGAPRTGPRAHDADDVLGRQPDALELARTRGVVDETIRHTEPADFDAAHATVGGKLEQRAAEPARQSVFLRDQHAGVALEQAHEKIFVERLRETCVHDRRRQAFGAQLRSGAAAPVDTRAVSNERYVFAFAQDLAPPDRQLFETDARRHAQGA